MSFYDKLFDLSKEGFTVSCYIFLLSDKSKSVRLSLSLGAVDNKKEKIIVFDSQKTEEEILGWLFEAALELKK